MTESDFWSTLEYRVTREFAGLPEDRYRRFWCDGFLPDAFMLDAPTPRIEGKAWICDGPTQMDWSFRLLLPTTYASREALPWSSLVPSDELTHWMSFDVARMRIELDPGAAKPFEE